MKFTNFIWSRAQCVKSEKLIEKYRNKVGLLEETILYNCWTENAGLPLVRLITEGDEQPTVDRASKVLNLRHN